jgi:hypothetical protein
MPTDGADLARLSGPEAFREETPEPPDLFALPIAEPDDAPAPTPLRPRRWVAWQTWDAATACPGALHGPRRDRPDGSKEIPWPRGAHPAELVYFATRDHRPPAPGTALVLTEGEKAAEAVAAAGYVAAGTVCGALTDPADAVVELLARYRLTVAPDNDEPGRRHMSRILERLERLGADAVRWVDPPADAPKGWDLADVDADRRRELIDGAHELAGWAMPEPAPRAWPEPEDRGTAVLSDLGTVEYVEDLDRPGRIRVHAGEEGSGKSFSLAELAIRVAVAGGSFAGAWPVLQTGPVLVLSEMHADDDYAREAMILDALDIDRAALRGQLYRLPLMTAAGGPPALTVAEWRAWVTEWMRERGVLLLIVDTGTGATQVDPWGTAIQAVYRDLRAMLEAYPALSIVLALHLKKPQGRGDRRLSDVLGEWGRWCDVVTLQEADGTTRTKLATYKRVRHQRRIVATRADGLLVDPVDTSEAKGSKVKPDAVLAAIEAAPGLTFVELGAALGVSHKTAKRYVAQLGEAVDTVAGVARSGPGAAARIFPVGTSGRIGTGTGVPMGVPITKASGGFIGTSGHPPYRGVPCPDVPIGAGDVDLGADEPERGSAALPPEPIDLFATAARPPCFGDPDLYGAHASDHRQVGDGSWTCERCEL